MDLSERESELLRMLHHARGCDGLKCSTCRVIDLRLLDGLPHASDDPKLRFDAVDKALGNMITHTERLYSHLEGAPVPASVRRAMHQLTEFLDKTRQLLRLPVTKSAMTPLRSTKPPRTPFRLP